MKKFLGFCKYWYGMYDCVGFGGVILMAVWPNKSGNKTDYKKIWEDKSL